MGNVSITGRHFTEFLHFPSPPPQNPGAPAAWTTALQSETKQALYIFFIPGKQIALSSWFNSVSATPFGSQAFISTPITLGNWTDLACGKGGVIVSTTAGLFQKWMVGFSFVITAGTNFAAGTYSITYFLDSQHVVVASSPSPSGVGSGGTATINVTLLPVMNIPKGASQQVDELNGQSNISTFNITAIDPSGALRTLAADTTAIGQITMLTLGFPGLDISQFQTLHTNRIAGVGRDTEGRISIRTQELMLQLVENIFVNGGPDFWQMGAPTNPQHTPPPAVRDNGIPVSDANPRYFAGNPLNLALAAMQNELGMGQTSPPSFVVVTGGGSGTGMAGYAINPNWAFFDGINDSTLINPNPYVDVAGIIALRDNEFSGDRMEFKFTSSQGGKGWIEDQILKPLGLYFVTLPTGELSLKTMKHPAATAVAAATAITDSQIDGIPDTERWPVINMIQATIPADTDATTTTTIPFVQQTSLLQYQSPYSHSIDSDGLRFVYGGFGKLFLVCARIFNRHAFATPVYVLPTFLEFVGLPLGGFVSLTHPLLFDLKTGLIGVKNVLCEIVERSPDYANGKITLKVADMRFMQISNGAFQIAPAGVPVWASASGAQKLQYIFISDNTGLMSDAAAGNQIE